jgi:hypothetical protein
MLELLYPSVLIYHWPRNPDFLKIEECSDIRGTVEEILKLLLLESMDNLLGPTN